MLSRLHNCPQHVSQHQMWGLCRIQVRYIMPQWQASWQQSDYSDHALPVINGRRSHPHPHPCIRRGLFYGLTQSETCSVHANDKQKQHKCVCTHAHGHKHTDKKTRIQSWINKSGYNLSNEPYGTSMGSSITLSNKMAGSLSVCVSVCVCVDRWVADRVSSSPVCTACQLIFKGYKYGLLPLKLCIILASVCVYDRVCACVCVCVFQVYSHWLNEPAVCEHVSPPCESPLCWYSKVMNRCQILIVRPDSCLHLHLGLQAVRHDSTRPYSFDINLDIKKIINTLPLHYILTPEGSINWALMKEQWP